MILLKVSGVWTNLEVFGGRVALVEIFAECIEEFGDSFCNVIACFYAIGNNLKLVFSSSVIGKV